MTIQEIKVFFIGMGYAFSPMCRHYNDNMRLMIAYDRGEELAHRLTFNLWR